MSRLSRCLIYAGTVLISVAAGYWLHGWGQKTTPPLTQIMSPEPGVKSHPTKSNHFGDVRGTGTQLRVNGKPASGAILNGNAVEMLQAALEQGPPLGQATMLQVLSNIRLSEVEDVLAWLKGHRSADGSTEQQQVFYMRWGQLAPEAALAHISELVPQDPFAAGPNSNVEFIFKGLTEVDPKAAIALFEASLDEDTRYAGAAGLAQQWARNEPAEAVKWALSLANEKAAALSGTIRGMHVAWGTARTLSWWRTLDQPADQALAFGSVSDFVFKPDSECSLSEQIEFAKQGVTLSPDDVAKANGLAQRWTKQNPREAIDFFSNLTPLIDTDNPSIRGFPALSSSLKEWIEMDVEAAGHWLAELPPATTYRDTMIYQYVNEIRREDPDAAAQWLQQVKDPEISRQLLRYFRP